MGPDSLPFLLDALDDKTPTKLIMKTPTKLIIMYSGLNHR
jgi:hypothetical protein